MLATIMVFVASFHIWDYFMTIPIDATEFVMTNEYIEIFGGSNYTAKNELRTCIRGDMVTN
jgi:hypothetical protein